MPRDYKRSSTRKKKTATTPSWLWLLGGFGMGLVAAMALMHNLGKNRSERPVPAPQVAMQPQSSRDADAETSGDNSVPSTDRVATRKLLPPPGEAGFEFYDMLPNFDFVVADESDDDPVTAQPRRSSSKTTIKKKPGTYILQAGSFRKFADADRRKAELAFQGFESNIQRVVLGNDQIWHRVYIGPTRNLAQLENQRSALRAANIDVLMLRMKP